MDWNIHRESGVFYVFKIQMHLFSFLNCEVVLGKLEVMCE